ERQRRGRSVRRLGLGGRPQQEVGGVCEEGSPRRQRRRRRSAFGRARVADDLGQVGGQAGLQQLPQRGPESLAGRGVGGQHQRRAAGAEKAADLRQSRGGIGEALQIGDDYGVHRAGRQGVVAERGGHGQGAPRPVPAQRRGQVQVVAQQQHAPRRRR